MNNEIESVKGNIISNLLRLHDLRAINSDTAMDMIKNVARINPNIPSRPQVSQEEELMDDLPFVDEDELQTNFDKIKNLKGGHK